MNTPICRAYIQRRTGIQWLECRSSHSVGFYHAYTGQYPMQLVAPSAVTIAVAILAIICTINLMVSLLLIMFHV